MMKSKNFKRSIAFFILLLLVSNILVSLAESNDTIEDIVLAAYVPEGDNIKNRDRALYKNAREHFRFDENGEVIWQRTFSPTRGSSFSLQTQTVTRDKDGEPLEILEVDDRTDEQTARFVFDYENSPNAVTIQHLNSNDELKSIEVERYDDRGNLVSREITNISSGDITKTDIEYNDKDLPERKVRYNADGATWIWTYEYDEAGNTTKDILQAYDEEDNYDRYISLYEYDEHSNVVSITSLDEDDEVDRKTLFEYIYDEHDNWITKRKYNVANPAQGEGARVEHLAFVWERQINYSGSVASDMRDEGCIFLLNTLTICNNDTLEYLRQDTNRHITTQIIFPVDDNEFMSERVYYVALDIMLEETCVEACLDRHISEFTEQYLSQATQFSFDRSEKTSIGGYEGTLLFFNNEEKRQNFQSATEGVFLTHINGHLITLSSFHVYNMDTVDNETIENEIQNAILANLSVVNEM